MPILLSPGEEVELELTYTNIIYIPSVDPADADIDGVMIFAFRVPIRVNEVAFGGAENITVNADKPKAREPQFDDKDPKKRIDDKIIWDSYDAPHWRDKKGSGTPKTVFKNEHIDPEGDRNYPIAYIANARMELGALISADIPKDWKASIRSVAKRNGTTMLETDEQPATVSADKCIHFPSKYNTSYKKGDPSKDQFVASKVNAPIGNTIDVYNADAEKDSDDDKAFEINWQIKINSSDWHTFQTTKHTVYIIRAAPVSTAALMRTETLFNIGCRGARGVDLRDTNAKDIIDKLFTVFRTKTTEGTDGQQKTPPPKVQRVIPSTGTLQEKGMTYWGDYNVLTKSNLSYYTTYLLEHGDGRCGAWARLFVDVARAQGYDLGEDVFIKAKRYQSGFDSSFHSLFPKEKIPKKNSSVFFVKNWVSNAVNPNLIKEADGVAGQSNPNPRSDFSDHGIVSVSTDTTIKNLYDPSYGTGPFTNVEDWAKQSLEGVGLHLSSPLPFVGNPPDNCNPRFWLQTPKISGNDFITGHQKYEQLEFGYDNFGK